MQKPLPCTWSRKPDGSTCIKRHTLPLDLLVMPHYVPVCLVSWRLCREDFLSVSCCVLLQIRIIVFGFFFFLFIYVHTKEITSWSFVNVSHAEVVYILSDNGTAWVLAPVFHLCFKALIINYINFKIDNYKYC